MKQQLSLRPTLILAVVLVLPAFVSAQVGAPEPPAVPKDALPGHFAEERHTSTSEVMAVDAATRLITLREEGEEPQLYSVDKEVRNLDQVKVGDRVKVDQYVSTSIKVLKEGELGDKEVATIDRSQPGEKPGGVATRTRTRIERVSSIFPDSKEFLTRNDKGRLTTWKVKDAKDLENLKSGDRVQFTSISSLAVRVTAAPPTTAPTAIPAGATTGPTTAPSAAPAAPGSAAPAAPGSAAPAAPGS
jgi:Cu/Ag efflux protein CusF